MKEEKVWANFLNAHGYSQINSSTVPCSVFMSLYIYFASENCSIAAELICDRSIRLALKSARHILSAIIESSVFSPNHYYITFTFSCCSCCRFTFTFKVHIIFCAIANENRFIDSIRWMFQRNNFRVPFHPTNENNQLTKTIWFWIS